MKSEHTFLKTNMLSSQATKVCSMSANPCLIKQAARSHALGPCNRTHEHSNWQMLHGNHQGLLDHLKYCCHWTSCWDGITGIIVIHQAKQALKSSKVILVSTTMAESMTFRVESASQGAELSWSSLCTGLRESTIVQSYTTPPETESRGYSIYFPLCYFNSRIARVPM